MSMEKGQTEQEMDFVRHVLNSLYVQRSTMMNMVNWFYVVMIYHAETIFSVQAGRRTTREESPLNWTQIFDVSIHQIRVERSISYASS